jgi:glycosyltransferase involved in cell wall biosynthesis
MRLAIVVDWLTDSGGAEQVFSEALKVFPGSEVHCLVDQMSDADHDRLGIPRAHTSWLQALVGEKGNYRRWLPMMPAAIRTLDMSRADVVLAISHSVALRAPVKEGQKLLCLSLSPMRYAWDLRDQYLKEAGLDGGLTGIAANLLLDGLRSSDAEAAKRVDSFAAISKHIADRVLRSYGRESEVIYPPVDTTYYNFESTADGSRQTAASKSTGVEAGSYYVTASRFVPYKRVDLIVEAFTAEPSRKLVVIGDGPDGQKVRAAASGAKNIQFTGHAGRAELRSWLRGAKAFVFAADEDFGIAPVEAQACGCPVIAFGRGGALETVVSVQTPAESTGVFFPEQTARSLREAIERFEANEKHFRREVCRKNAERFSADKFRAALKDWVGRNTVVG